jgi:ornithine cyclodeaminase
MPTLLLTRSEVAALLDPATLASDLRAAFRAYSSDPTLRAQRAWCALPGPGSATVLFAGLAPGVPAYTVKVNAKFPAEQPAIRGLICLSDLQTGQPLAVMDSSQVTAVRTGLCGALAADTLARRDADTVAVVGAGVQGEQQLRSLCALRSIRRAWVHDSAPERAASFADRLAAPLDLQIEVSPSAGAAIAQAAIVLVATWARQPFILPGMLKPGTHVTTLGPDEPGKCEVSAEVIRDAVFVCDDRELCVTMGAIGGAGLGPESIAAELGDVLAGAHPGRTNPRQVTIYGGVGLAFQDLVAAWQVYRAARAKGVGREIDFLA